MQSPPSSPVYGEPPTPPHHPSPLDPREELILAYLDLRKDARNAILDAHDAIRDMLDLLEARAYGWHDRGEGDVTLSRLEELIEEQRGVCRERDDEIGKFCDGLWKLWGRIVEGATEEEIKELREGVGGPWE